jgi:hypothetical protein
MQDSGAVYVFTRTGIDWNEQAFVKASNPTAVDNFGGSVSLSGNGNTMAVGTPLYGGLNEGIVYVFTRSGNVWSEEDYVEPSNSSSIYLFGRSVSLSEDGDTLAIGASGDDSSMSGIDPLSPYNEEAHESGAVYIYTRSASDWSEQSYIKASNSGAGDQFGRSVSVSDNGDILAVGAPLERSSTTGINPVSNDNWSNAGAVYLFRRSITKWSQYGFVKATNTTPRDQFGVAVTLDRIGNTLATGAWLEDGIAIDSGAVYVY